MKTEHTKTAETLLREAIKEHGEPRDMDADYRAMLDECYSFKGVGGPFTHMQPSQVLEDTDPTAFRCGFNDWLDSEEVTEVGGEYYSSGDISDIKDGVVDALDSEVQDMERDLEELREDLSTEEDAREKERIKEETESLTDAIADKMAVLEAVKLAEL